MSYSYSYKSSNSSGGVPGGANYSYQSSGPSGSSYSYHSSSSSSGTPLRGNDAEFQAAKMQAMMGAPMAGSGGSSSYTYKSSSSSSAAPNIIHTGLSSGKTMAEMEAEMNRMQHGMERPASGGSSYSYSSHSSTKSGAPKLITPETKSTGGTTVKKVVTTTTTKSDPHAVRELESIERDFSRLGRVPDNYSDDFDKIKKDIMTGEAYQGATVTHEPVVTKIREEVTRSSHGKDSSLPRPIPVDVGHKNGLHETTTTTTTKTYSSGGGPNVTEEKVVTSSGRNSDGTTAETFIPIRTHDNTFDDLHMNRWMDHKDQFGSFGVHDLDMNRMEWQNRLGGLKRDFFTFSPHSDLGSTHIESSRTVSKRRPVRRTQSCRTTRTYFTDSVSLKRNPLGKPEFSVQFEMRDFKPEDINLSTKHGKLIINASREEKIGGSTSRREFTRTVDLPSDIQINLMRSVYSRDGVLSITAPIKPPHYDPVPPPITMTGFSSMPPSQQYVTPQHSSEFMPTPSTSTSHRASPFHSDFTADVTSRNTARTTPTGANESQNAFSYNVSVIGFKPEDITVSVEGRKVKVHGKHVETSVGGRKSSNEFTKMFDLPANVDPNKVQSFIKDGHTLFVIAQLKEDEHDSVEYIPVNKKV